MESVGSSSCRPAFTVQSHQNYSDQPRVSRCTRPHGTEHRPRHRRRTKLHIYSYMRHGMRWNPERHRTCGVAASPARLRVRCRVLVLVSSMPSGRRPHMSYWSRSRISRHACEWPVWHGSCCCYGSNHTSGWARLTTGASERQQLGRSGGREAHESACRGHRPGQNRFPPSGTDSPIAEFSLLDGAEKAGSVLFTETQAAEHSIA
jgi:hypothetical protein